VEALAEVAGDVRGAMKQKVDGFNHWWRESAKRKR
jgi:hypothetical protein